MTGNRWRLHLLAWALGSMLLLGIGLAGASDQAPSAILLVARNDLPDSLFADSVVLVLNNLGPAPAGVIINKPTQIPVSRLFPDLKRLEPLPDKVYLGGPVEIGSVWFLFRSAAPREHAVQACNGVYLSADRDLLLHLLERDKPMDGLRVFVGHSGWGPGQLESEIAGGAWKLKHANPEVIFHGTPEHPWPAPRTPKGST